MVPRRGLGLPGSGTFAMPFLISGYRPLPFEQNHQGLGNRLIAGPSAGELNGAHPVQCRERLGGLLRYYHRDVT
jgi:hypothetical protein